MVNLTVPGVKIQEVATLPPSIAPVDTAIPVFVGYTEKNQSKVKKIKSFLEFEEFFGGPEIAAELTVALSAGNVVNSSTIVTVNSSTLNYLMYYSVKAFYDNGGGDCYVSSVDVSYQTSGLVEEAKLEAALAKVSKEDEPTLIIIPDAIKLASASLYGAIQQKALLQCATLKDRFSILDSYSDTSIPDTRDTIGNANLKYGAAYFPKLKTVYPLSTTNSKITVSGTGFTTNTLAELIANSPPITGNPITPILTSQILAVVNAKLSTYTAIIGPCGALAGIYARTDFDRGVWKAPANISISAISGTTIAVGDDLQNLLNVDATSGKSINAIRFFSGQGTLVWGARTLAGNDNEWRYINVRRLLIFIEESSQKASAQFVFEPNTGQTWQRMKGMLDNFLTNLWRQGALAGAKPDDAFFVRVGLGTTMTSQDILEGIMNIEIGVAPTRPAEFIVLKFSHKLQVS